MIYFSESRLESICNLRHIKNEKKSVDNKKGVLVSPFSFRMEFPIFDHSGSVVRLFFQVLVVFGMISRLHIVQAGYGVIHK